MPFHALWGLVSSFKQLCCNWGMWCTASGGMWAVSGWGRYCWYHTVHSACLRLLPCCKAGRCESSLAPSPSSLVLRHKPIFVDGLRIFSGGVEICAHTVVCQLFSEENSLWQKRGEFWDRCYCKVCWQDCLQLFCKALCGTDVEESCRLL